MKLLRHLFLIIAFALLLVACNTDEPTVVQPTATSAETTDNPPPTSTPAPAPTEAPTDTPPPAPTDAPTAEPEDAPLSLSDMRSDFGDFSSYTLDVVLSVISADSGERTQYVEMQMQISVDPPQQHISMQAFGVDDSLANAEMAIEMVTVDAKTYMVVPEMGCIGLPSGGLQDTPFADMTSASTFLDGVENARRIRPNETINGIESEHYVFDETFFEAATADDQIEGHLYIDAATQHLVRLEMSGNGADFANLSGQESNPNDTFSLVYDVVNVNQPFEVTVPDGCEDDANGNSYPQLADAFEITSFDGLLSYKSASSMTDAIAFYQAEMETAGWTYLEDDSFISDATSSLMFSQADQSIMILVAPESDNVSITILEQ